MGVPGVGALLGEEVVVFPRFHQAGQDCPFGYCRAMDAGRSGDRDVGGGVEGVGLDVVAAGGEEVHPGQVWGVGFGVGGEGGEGYEDCCFGEEGGWRGVLWVAGGVVVGDV